MRARRKQPGRPPAQAASRQPPFPAAALRLFLLLLLAATSAPTARAAFKNDFSGYPTGAQACLSRAADASGCDGDTVQAMNECLCGNQGGFVLGSAACVARSSAPDLEATYETLATHCSDSKTPLGVSQAQFFAAASSGTASSATRTGGASTSSRASSKATSVTSASANPTGPSSSSSSSMTTKTTMSDGHTVTETVAVPVETGASQGGSGPNSTAKTGIIAGACVAGVAILAALLGFWLWYRRRKAGGARDESHPMLAPQQGFRNSGKFGGGGPVAGAGEELQDWKGDGKWAAAGGQQGAAAGTWDSSSAGTYNSAWGAQQYQGWGYDPTATPYSQYGGGGQLSQQQQEGVYELAGHEPVRPVEVPATPAWHGYGGQTDVGAGQQRQSWGQQHPQH
ncbi:uncharacterized protein E0L32_006996 [Thyridium curvatum]|uniref:Uncharacterized protein n=1 Tax=Thyridium curvatum TaxID=1093900 RepID=A0A507B4T1_9PEZI|nr:uncharacterized protein E0L32_006996 [Thyridium curvatum]TPX12349.1 hypothetical protein E0L32_006996 [Thyridium curvatum]